MSKCPCCSNSLMWHEFERVLGTKMNYCPVCGQSRAVIDFLKYADAIVRGVVIETVRDENGKPMILDRTPWAEPSPDKPSATPISYEVNLDKIDISKEMELLDAIRARERARRTEFLAERIVEHILRKENENKN